MSPQVPQPEFKRIVLTGFMGSGKTTVGRLLAAELGWEFADLDAVVEVAAGKSVPRIFAEDGEEAFRVAELVALQALLAQPHQVIALGGGAVGTPALRERLAASPETIIVHLQAPFPVLYERCRREVLDPDATARPLLGTYGAAEERFTLRQRIYAAVAHLTVDVGSATPLETVANLLAHWPKQG